MENNKNYTWLPEERFDISGMNLGIVNKFVDMVLNSEQAQIVLFAQQCKSIMNETLKKGFEEGKLKEVSVEVTQSANGIDFDVRKDSDAPEGFRKLSSNGRLALLCTDKNHSMLLQDNQEETLKFFNVKKGDGEIVHEAESFDISSWKTPDTDFDDKGNPLDIYLHDNAHWIPKVEYNIFHSFLNGKNFNKLSWGYIDGISSHLGKVPTKGMQSSGNHSGYRLWIEIS